MKSLLSILSALAEETRLRAFLLLRERELCVCQVIEVLGLSPSTVSRHMSILHDAGLVERRKDGKWHYYRVAAAKAGSTVGRAVRMVLHAGADDPMIAADQKKCRGVEKKGLEEVCACYRS
jgi:DNA-binding transcriptional ArsR family regulator